MKRYYFATSNDFKFKEVSRILKKINPNIQIEQLKIEVDEIQGTPEEISIHKTKKIFREYMFSIFANKFDGIFTEDVSLHCEGLYGMPGPYIKDTLKNVGVDNLSKLVISTGNTAVEAKCCYTLQKINTRNDNFITVCRSAYGNIVEPRSNASNNNFGFESIFAMRFKTFAEMDPNEKDCVSHRRFALEALNEFL